MQIPVVVGTSCEMGTNDYWLRDYSVLQTRYHDNNHEFQQCVMQVHSTSYWSLLITTISRGSHDFFSLRCFRNPDLTPSIVWWTIATKHHSQEESQTYIRCIHHHLWGITRNGLNNEVIILRSTNHKIRHWVPWKHFRREDKKILHIISMKYSDNSNIPVSYTSVVKHIKQLAMDYSPHEHTLSTLFMQRIQIVREIREHVLSMGKHWNLSTKLARLDFFM